MDQVKTRSLEAIACHIFTCNSNYETSYLCQDPKASGMGHIHELPGPVDSGAALTERSLTLTATSLKTMNFKHDQGLWGAQVAQ